MTEGDFSKTRQALDHFFNVTLATRLAELKEVETVQTRTEDAQSIIFRYEYALKALKYNDEEEIAFCSRFEKGGIDIGQIVKEHLKGTISRDDAIEKLEAARQYSYEYLKERGYDANLGMLTTTDRRREAEDMQAIVWNISAALNRI